MVIARDSRRHFGSEVALGKITGYRAVNKFGESINCDNDVPTDLWDGADGATSTAVWVPPTQARIHTIVSTSDTDSDTGGSNPQAAGARTIRVYYLADWDTAEAAEDIVLDGTAGVAMSNAAVIIHRMHMLTWGANGVNAGVITATAATDGTVTASILAGSNQTQMCIYGIPAKQSLLILKMYAGVVKGTGTTKRFNGVMLVMIDADTNVADNTAWTIKESFSNIETSPPWVHDYRDTPKVIQGPAIIKIQVTANANDSNVIGAFDGFLVNI